MKKIVFALCLLFLILGVAVCYLFSRSSDKVAYVEIGKIYSEFKLTKELEKQFVTVTNARKSFLDSIEIKIRAIMNDKAQEEEFIRLKDQYMNSKKQFDEDNVAMNSQMNQQIMKQLNDYIAEFGKKNNYDFIFGAEGSGSLMYANEGEYNVTASALTYINDRYEGK